MSRSILTKVHDLNLPEQEKLWRKFKSKAAAEGKTVLQLLIEVLKKEVKA